MLSYKEYLEAGVDEKILISDFMPAEEYVTAHRGLVIFCHDIFISYNGGILLVKRKLEPAKNELWPIGGRVLRGMSVARSAARKTKEETGLHLKTVKMMGIARTYFGSDPFGHGKGVDTINAVLYGVGEGELKLDDLHEKPVIIKPEDYTPELKSKLSPYVNDYLKIAIKGGYRTKKD